MAQHEAISAHPPWALLEGQTHPPLPTACASWSVGTLPSSAWDPASVLGEVLSLNNFSISMATGVLQQHQNCWCLLKSQSYSLSAFHVNMHVFSKSKLKNNAEKD